MIASQRSALSLVVAAIAATTFLGCSNDAETAREIQTQRQRQVQAESEQDHLGDAFSLVQRLVELNPEKAHRQIAYHLNRWLDDRPGQTSSSGQAETAVPALLQTINDLLPIEQSAERVGSVRYVPSDVNHLRDCYMFRQIVQWIDQPRGDDPLLADWLAMQEEKLGASQADQLRTASRLFDWTIRNIALEPPRPADSGSAPEMPLEMEFEGPGYRQSDYQSVWRGTGDSLQRAGVFIQLCRQAEIPAFVLSIQSNETGELKPWCVGVLVGADVYLFEPELGSFVPGPGQAGIATLAQARTDESVLRRLNVPGFFDYPLSKNDVQQCTALLNVLPEGVSSRMRWLESGLTGNRRMVVYDDVDGLAEQIDAAAGVAGVRLWRVPLLAEVYKVAMEKEAERDPMFSFWYYSRWAILDPVVSASQKLAVGRWRHLHGQFDDNPELNIEGARTLYLAQRAPEFEIEKLDIDVDLQLSYGIRRELGTSKEVYDRQVEQVQMMMRLAKRTATYWLSLIQYDDESYETAEKWLSKRALNEEQSSFWEPAARYNLARACEQMGQIDRAIELYKTQGEPQEHGNRIRARLIEKAAQ
jgi:hypothetical protein